MSETTSKGDRMLVGLGKPKPVGETDLLADASLLSDAGLPEQVAAQMEARVAETQRLRDAMLTAGVSVEVLEDPEGAEMDHLDEDEQGQFNDAVREHRAFCEELERDMRELQRARDAAGIRYRQDVVSSAISTTALPSITKETES